MNLLKYEFSTGPQDSINGMLRTLVTELRFNRSHLTMDEFKTRLPELFRIEAAIQRLDSQMGQPRVNYIEQIMDEMDKEDENENNLNEDLNRATVSIIKSLSGADFVFDQLSFTTGRTEHYYWLRFDGYVNDQPVDARLLIAKDIFRSICNRYNYIFIDLS